MVRDTGSNAPARVNPVWVNAVLIDAEGEETLLSSLTPHMESDRPRHTEGGLVYVTAPSVLRYSLDGKRFVQLRGAVDVANPRSEIGSTLNPSLRFFIFDTAPDLARLVPPERTLPMPPPAQPDNARALVDRLFWQAFGRAPSQAERAVAEQAVVDPNRPARLAPDGVADLLWAVLMKPEFQLIY